ncbi:MAG: ABC transporter permease [Ignavibacteria bacterium]|nr:ABC transporter permease [Ignavibacteria bacterium]
MPRYIFRRVLSAIPLIFGLLTVTFFVVHLAPGDPTSFYMQADVDPQYAENLRRAFGLDQPLLVQYWKWLGSTLSGDLGVSFSKHAPVRDILIDTIPKTLLLTSAALVLDFAVGIALGIVSALRRGTTLDRVMTVIALFLYSMPEFWLGLMLVLAFSGAIPLFPATGMQSPMADYLPPLEYVLDVLHHMVLPVFVLGIASAAATARYMRASMLEVIHLEYIRAARAKGLSEFIVIGKHALRNALLPIITLGGLSLPFLLGGAVIVESVFGWPGMGKVVVDAIFTRDYPLIIACTMISGIMVILGNLTADILSAFADPRIRLE